jgi:hypothetical protein
MRPPLTDVGGARLRRAACPSASRHDGQPPRATTRPPRPRSGRSPHRRGRYVEGRRGAGSDPAAGHQQETREFRHTARSQRAADRRPRHSGWRRRSPTDAASVSRNAVAPSRTACGSRGAGARARSVPLRTGTSYRRRSPRRRGPHARDAAGRRSRPSRPARRVPRSDRARPDRAVPHSRCRRRARPRVAVPQAATASRRHTASSRARS